MDLTPREIQEKQFHDVFRGYSHEEVDLFLDEVAESFDRVFRENQTFHHRLRELEEQLTTARATEDMLKRTLISAQKTAEEAVSEARVSAQETVAEAERSAAKVISDAERRAAEIVDNATRRGRELEVSVEGMKRFEQEYRARLQAFIESQLRVLNEGPVAPEMPSSMPARTAGPAKVDTEVRPAGPAERREPPAGASVTPASAQPGVEGSPRLRETPRPAEPVRDTNPPPAPARPGNGQPPGGSESPRQVATGAARPEVRIHSTESSAFERKPTSPSVDSAPGSTGAEKIDEQVQAAIRRAGELRPGGEREPVSGGREPDTGSFVNPPRPKAAQQSQGGPSPRPPAPEGNAAEPAVEQEGEFEDEASIKKLFWGEE